MFMCCRLDEASLDQVRAHFTQAAVGDGKPKEVFRSCQWHVTNPAVFRTRAGQQCCDVGLRRHVEHCVDGFAFY